MIHVLPIHFVLGTTPQSQGIYPNVDPTTYAHELPLLKLLHHKCSSCRTEVNYTGTFFQASKLHILSITMRLRNKLQEIRNLQFMSYWIGVMIRNLEFVVFGFMLLFNYSACVFCVIFTTNMLEASKLEGCIQKGIGYIT